MFSRRALGDQLNAIRPETFAGQPEWVTWHFLNQALAEDAATDVCRSELWNVSALGWQASLSQVASIQPVGSDNAREQALARWRKVGAWVDQEIANLKEGQRLGYSATQASVKVTIGQLDGVVDMSAKDSGSDGTCGARQDSGIRCGVGQGNRGHRAAGAEALSELPAR